MWFKVAAMAGGLALLWFVSLSDWVDRHLSNAVSSLLDRYTELQVRDYASLMHLTDEYRLVDMLLEHDDWVVGRKLGNTRLRDEGIVVLAIERSDDTFLGTPQGDTELKEGDRMIVYGRVEALQRLDERRKGFTGQVSHEEAVAEQDKVVEEEERKDQADDEDGGGEDAAEQRDDG